MKKIKFIYFVYQKLFMRLLYTKFLFIKIIELSQISNLVCDEIILFVHNKNFI